MEEVLFLPSNDYVLGTLGSSDEDLFGSVGDAGVSTEQNPWTKMHTTEVSDSEDDYEHAAPAAPKVMPRQIAAKKNKCSMDSTCANMWATASTKIDSRIVFLTGTMSTST